MATKNIEAEVKKQAALLAKEMPKLVISTLLVGKFVGFFNGEIVVENSHEQCFAQAEKQFGEHSGFVISEVSQKKLIASALVKF